jgi:mannose-1-phosphate guanylyltransferase/mannose-6-phosphate isomerase
MAEGKFVSLIMAGGSGTRFWPMSRKDLPKQYLNLVGNTSLIQQTAQRLEALSSPEDIYICSGESQKSLLQKQLPQIKNLILEPAAKNTAPCIMLSVATFLAKGYSRETVMGVFPADHYIRNQAAFGEILNAAATTARKTKGLVTLGIKPTSPHTGYGYIEATAQAASGFSPAKRFVEKPTLEKAKEFLGSGNFYWNGGIFAWTLGAIEEALLKFCKEDFEAIQKASPSDLPRVYQSVKSLPIDKAVMEKASNVFIVPAEMGWSDVGSWSAIHELEAPTDKENVGDNTHCHFLEASGNLVKAPAKKKVAIIGVSNIIVVDTGDSLLIVDKSHDQMVRKIAEHWDK